MIGIYRYSPETTVLLEAGLTLEEVEVCRVYHVYMKKRNTTEFTRVVVECTKSNGML